MKNPPSISRQIRDYHSGKRDRERREERLRKHHEKLDTLKALRESYEAIADGAEVVRLTGRIRLLEQQIRYIGGDV
jgi:hypothetical protein